MNIQIKVLNLYNNDLKIICDITAIFFDLEKKFYQMEHFWRNLRLYKKRMCMIDLPKHESLNKLQDSN